MTELPIARYQILQASDPKTLEEQVTAYIQAEGWEPIGGVSHTAVFDTTQGIIIESWSQAMVTDTW